MLRTEIIAYSGTTVENYRTCAFPTVEGIRFLKTAEPRQGHSLFFAHTLKEAADYAIARANELGHEPLVIVGKVSAEYAGSQELPPGTEFFVDAVYTADGTGWKIPGSDITRLFDEKSPGELLKVRKV